MPKRHWFLDRTYDTILGGLSAGDEAQIEACIRMALDKQSQLQRRVRSRSPWALRNLIAHLPKDRQDLVMAIAFEMAEIASIQAIDPDAGLPPPDLGPMHPEDVEALSALAL